MIDLKLGDCLDVIKKIPDNSVDSIITDPPYGLGFMGKSWDTFDKSQFGLKGNEGKNDLKVKKNFNVLPRYKTDGLYTFSLNWATEGLRVLKSGGHLISFGGTRTYHKIASGIEDSGFEIRDQLQWLYGSGFPKSYNIGKGVDKLQGNQRDVIGVSLGKGYSSQQEKNLEEGFRKYEKGLPYERADRTLTKGNSVWEGWGSALKPANEPIVLARKPLSEKSIVENVLKWGVGGLNINACRILYRNEKVPRMNVPYMRKANNNFGGGKDYRFGKVSCSQQKNEGRFPSNILFDEEAGKLLDEQTGVVTQGHWSKSKVTGFGNFGGGKSEYFGVGKKDKTKSGASRFFYVAKASKSEKTKYLDSCKEF